MALESWVAKVKSAISTGIDSVLRTGVIAIPIPIVGRRKPNVRILAFEIASLMSKLLHLWRSLSDTQITRLRNEVIVLEGVRKVVSNDDAFLLSLACAEFTESLRMVAESASTLTTRCTDPALLQFDKCFKEFADSGHDPNHWVMSWREMESKAKKMDRFLSSTAALYKEMDELSEAEQGLRKLLQSAGGCHQKLPVSKISAVADAQQKIFWQRQEVKYLKRTSLWACTFDAVMLLVARSAFTVLARIKNSFVGTGHEPCPLPRSISLSATVYPSAETPPAPRFVSGPLMPAPKHVVVAGFFESSAAMLEPPGTTLGAAALAMHYANLIVVVEKMIRSPRAVGPDARDDLYAMLPARVRALLRARLKGMGWAPARDPGLAAEWRAALTRIVGWLGPVAHNTIRWQGERSFERRSAAAPRANVLLLQTLYFANREKVEAAVTELLVGLNYVWRFEMAMSAEALIQSISTTQTLDSSCLD